MNVNDIHVVGCNVWSDYSADVIFDDGTALCFGTGLDAFVRASRHASHSQRLAIDLQHHYTSHALSKDLAHVGAALKVISTISPRCKFLRCAVNAIHQNDADEGIVFWKSQTASLEEFIAPPKDDKKNVIINPEDNSVTVIAVGGNASLWLSPNGAFFDVTWPCRAFESDGRSIQFIASEFNQPKINDRGVNTVKSTLCVPHQQRFPVGLAVDAFRKFPKAPEYRNESVTDCDFWAPLACWAPLLRVALRVWKEQRGGVCPESVNQFLEVLSEDAQMLLNAMTSRSSNNNNSNTNRPSDQQQQQSSNPMNRNFSSEDPVCSNFPAPIPPKVCAVVSPFPKLSVEDAATLLASTSDRLHTLPIHDRLHAGASLCVSWSSGDRCCWMSPEQGYARSMIFEDLSLLHIEGLQDHAPMALLHILNAVRVQSEMEENDEAQRDPTDVENDEEDEHSQQQQHQNDRIVGSALHFPTENERTSLVAATASATIISFANNKNEITNPSPTKTQKQLPQRSILESKLRISAAARVYSWATGSLEATSKHAPMLPSIVVIPSHHISCASTTPIFPLFTARVGSSDVDPRKGRYLHADVEFIASFLQTGKQTKRRAATSGFLNNHNYYCVGSKPQPLGAVSSVNVSGNHSSSAAKQQESLNRSTTIFGNPSLSSYEGIGAVRCSSTISGVGIFTSYQDGTCRCCFDDRTILTLKVESVGSTNNRLHLPGNRLLSIEEIFVTALDNRAVSTRFRAASCNPQHPMYNYLQYALPFMRYSALPPEEREQLCNQDPVSLTTCASDFDGKGDMFHGDAGSGSVVSLATQLERVIARSHLTLMKHNESSMKRQQMLDEF